MQLFKRGFSRTGNSYVKASRRLCLPAAVFVLGLASRAHAQITIDFENEPNLPAQPNNFAAAGAMQTFSKAGVYTISGGVVLGNPSFLAAFPTQGSAPNLYGTADFADPSLLDTITVDMPLAENVNGFSAVLFNGQSTPEDYRVDLFSGANLVSTFGFTNLPENSSAGGWAKFAISGSLKPITQVKITTPNSGTNGWDFFVDTIKITPGGTSTVPEPSSLVLFACAMGWIAWRRAAAKH